VCVPTALALGLLADYSRGPWLGAVSIYVAFVLFGRGHSAHVRHCWFRAGLGDRRRFESIARQNC